MLSRHSLRLTASRGVRTIITPMDESFFPVCSWDGEFGADLMDRKIERVFRAPYAVPNGLQLTDEGLWIVDQLTDRVALVEMAEPNHYGVTKILREIPSESSTTSGLTYGEGALWLAANGPGTRGVLHDPPTPVRGRGRSSNWTRGREQP